jgi:hypothetical protein
LNQNWEFFQNFKNFKLGLEVLFVSKDMTILVKTKMLDTFPFHKCFRMKKHVIGAKMQIAL